MIPQNLDYDKDDDDDFCQCSRFTVRRTPGDNDDNDIDDEW